MVCDPHCSCILCLELNGCDNKLICDNDENNNFILAPKKVDRVKDKKKFTFFGMEVDDNNNFKMKLNTEDQKIDKKEDVKTPEVPENKHRSVIYVNDNNKFISPEIKNSEIIDEQMSLEATESCDFINVIFKNTFSLATEIINEVEMCNDICYGFDDDDDEFPLGMEADLMRQFMEKKR